MIAPVTIMIIIVTGLVSAYAFSNPEFRSNALFVPAMIKNRGEYHRWVSAGFIHSDWMHLIFNMYALYIFGPYVEQLFAIIFGSPTIGAIAYILFTSFLFRQPPTLTIPAIRTITAIGRWGHRARWRP